MAKVNAFEVAPVTSTPKTETLIHIILDETGSMSSCQDSTISSFNEYLDSQSKVDDGHTCLVSLTMFSKGYEFARSWKESTSVDSNHVRLKYSHLDITKCARLTPSTFVPNGGTNLYDAIGHTITHLDQTTRDSQNVLVVILTDGEENASQEYNLQTINKMITERQDLGWTFVYLGANQDSWSVGRSLGLSKGQTLSYSTSNMGSTMRSLHSATTSYRSERSAFASVNASGTTARNFFQGENDDA